MVATFDIPVFQMPTRCPVNRVPKIEEAFESMLWGGKSLEKSGIEIAFSHRQDLQDEGGGNQESFSAMFVINYARGGKVVMGR